MRHVLLLGSVAIAAACAHESKQVVPVSTNAAGTSSTAAASAEVARRSAGLVRFVHTIPEVAAVDVYANDMRIFTGVTFGTVTPYREIPKDGYKIRIRPVGQDLAVPMAEGHEHVEAGKHYTAVAFREPKEGKAELEVFDDNLTPPEGGAAKMRVINACPDAGEIDVFTPAEKKPLFSGVDYDKATKYVELRPMTGAIELRREGEETPLATCPTTTLDAGKVYTLVVLGWSRGSPPTLRTLVVEDRFGTNP